MPTINGGAFLIARKITNSEIWVKPPYYIKLWIWLLGKCNHKNVIVQGQEFKRGECMVTIEETIEQTKYKAGWRTEKITKSMAWNFYEYLREMSMASTRKTTRGMFITVLNYNKYQDFRNYEHNSEDYKKTTRRQQSPNTINKNEKNEKNEKKKNNSMSTKQKNKERMHALINYWNETHQRKFRVPKKGGWTKNFELWLETYTLEEIQKAVDIAQTKHTFYRDKITPDMLFRTNTDRIGELLNYRRKPNVIGGDDDV